MINPLIKSDIMFRGIGSRIRKRYQSDCIALGIAIKPNKIKIP